MQVIKLVIFLFLLTGCSAKKVAINNNWSDFDIMRTGDEEGTTTTIDQAIENKMDDIGAKPLTPKQKKEFNDGFKKGMELVKKQNQEASIVMPMDVLPVNYPQNNFIKKFLSKNKKVCGIDQKYNQKNKHICIEKDFVFLLARAYMVFPEFFVFEGMRSKGRQRILYNKKVTKTLTNSWHFKGLAVDILAKDRRGKWSFDAIDRLGLARGVIYATFVNLQEMGMLTCYEWEHVTLWSFRDAYHIQLNKKRSCGGRTT